MKTYTTGCLVCGKDLQYTTEAVSYNCEVCKKSFEGTSSCIDGHYVCDACHFASGYESITDYAIKSTSKNPIEIATKMMTNKLINMHGPEHHYLIVAALLVAYKNSGGDIDLEKSLSKARERAIKVPGGICGLWGSCGAGIGTGIFISIATNATSLTEKEWSLANQMTSLSLNQISKNGGPRCCKRDTFLSILEAIKFSEENLNIKMETQDNIKCFFFNNNPSCKKEKCIFFKKVA